jgi:uncharacterized protein YjbI with pentapeptide repeats
MGKKQKQINLANKRQKARKTTQVTKPKKLQVSLIADVILRFENSALLRLLVILSIPAALYSLWLQYSETSAGNLGRSWSNLTTQSSGNSGKVPALEHLSSEIRELPYLDLSCEAMGGLDTLPDGSSLCTRPTYLSGLDLFEEGYFIYRSAFLAGSNFSETEIQFGDFSYGHLDHVSFTKASMMGAKFFRASLRDATLNQANLVNTNWSYSEAERATFRGANLLTAIFYAAYLPEADFSGANVSHAYFFGANLDGARFDNAWAWADMPPIGLPEVNLCKFEPAIHNRWEKPEECIPPEGKVRPLPPISLTSPLEEAECSFLEGLQLLLMEMTNGMTHRDCWEYNPSYKHAWLSGEITSKVPTLRWDQLMNNEF